MRGWCHLLWNLCVAVQPIRDLGGAGEKARTALDLELRVLPPTDIGGFIDSMDSAAAPCH